MLEALDLLLWLLELVLLRLDGLELESLLLLVLD